MAESPDVSRLVDQLIDEVLVESALDNWLSHYDGLALSDANDRAVLACALQCLLSKANALVSVREYFQSTVHGGTTHDNDRKDPHPSP